MRFKGMNLCDFCFEPVDEGKKCENCGLTHETYIADSRYLKPGTNLLGKYIVGRVLGSDEFGATYLAYSGEMNKVVAVKEYCPSELVKRVENEEKLVIISEDKRHIFDRGARQFFDEAKTISDFRMNKNIISVYDIFFDNDTVYYSMEYLNGVNLKDFIANKGGKLNEKEVITIMKCVCDALVSLHGKTILHGDISPNSIFMCNNGDVKLIEFAKAKKFIKNEMLKYSLAIESGKIPSEHHTMEKRTPYKDIYGLGSAAFYAVTGKIKEKDSEIIFDKSLNFSAHFINIIKKCLTSKAEESYKSAIELLSDLNLSTDYEGRCGNCHKLLGDDEYCRYCGTKRGEGKFEPYDNFIPCVYGSPNTYVHKCKKCGTEFQSSGMSVPRPSYCYKCGSSVTCEEENNDFSNIQGLQRPPLDNEFITVDGLDNVTQDKTPLDHFICFYSMFMDGHTGDGKRAGGSHELIYDNDKRTVEEIHNFYGESVEGGRKVDYCLIVPTHIKFEEDLIEYIKSKKPEWEFYLKSYQPKRKPFNPPLMGQIAAFPPPKKDKDKTFNPPPLAGIPAYRPPKDFDPKENIMPCVYGSPEQMSGIYGKKKVKKQKKWLFGLLLALGLSICAILIILILLNIK